jgi:hypothetical protein
VDSLDKMSTRHDFVFTGNGSGQASRGSPPMNFLAVYWPETSLLIGILFAYVLLHRIPSPMT